MHHVEGEASCPLKKKKELMRLLIEVAKDIYFFLR